MVQKAIHELNNEDLRVNIAYLINQYPKVSHSFIRREIAGLEACGIVVHRFAVRSCEAELVDEADKQELAKTQFLLSVGVSGLLLRLLQVAIARPVRFWQTLGFTIRIGWCSDRGLANHLAYLAEACVLLRWLAEAGATHVHAHFGTNSTTVAMLCRALGGPAYSFTVHGPEEFDKVGAIALAEKIQRAAFVVAVSSFGRSQLCRWCDYQQWSKIRVIRCGVDEAFLKQSLTPLPDRPRLVCVGRLSEQKGHFVLIEAIDRLVSEGVDLEVVLVGDGELRGAVEVAIAQRKLTEQVTITGWASTSEVQQYLLEARVMVLPSFAEGLPVVIMEALALGRPVISTYVAGIPELVQPGKTGWLVPAGSVEALTEALRSVLACPVTELEAMGKAGRERVAEHHNVAVEARILADTFLQFS